VFLTLAAEIENLYRDAVARRDTIAAAWKKEGSPLLIQGARGLLVEHPYLKMLRVHDRLVADLERRLRPGRVGRPPSAVPGLPPPLGEWKVRRVQ
jgi:hypothetical protein